MRAKRSRKPLNLICLEPVIGKWLEDYLDGRLTEDQARDFESHLELCLKCQEDIKDFNWLADRMKKLDMGKMVSALLKGAMRLLRQRKFDKGIKAFNQILKVEPKAHRAFYGLALCHLFKKNYVEWVNSIERGIEIDLAKGQSKQRYLSRAYNRLGWQYHLAWDFRKASICYRRAIERNPKFVTALRRLGGILARGEKYAEAGELFQEALDVSPGNIELLFDMAWLYKRTAEYERAIEYYKRVVNKRPASVEAYTEAGLCYYEIGKFGEAIDYFKKAINREPVDNRAYFYAGMSFFRQGNLINAISYFYKALEIDQENFAISYNLGCCYIAYQDYDEAIKTIGELLSKGLKYWPIFLALGTAYYKKGMFRQAVGHLERALKLGPKWPDNYLNLSSAYINSNMLKKAQKILTKAVKLHPSSSTYNNLGATYYLLGEPKKTALAFKRGYELNPLDDDLLGNVRMLYGESDWHNTREDSLIPKKVEKDFLGISGFNRLPVIEYSPQRISEKHFDLMKPGVPDNVSVKTRPKEENR